MATNGQVGGDLAATTPATKKASVGEDGATDNDLAATMTAASEVQEYPHGLKLVLTLVAVFVTMFLVALVSNYISLFPQFDMTTSGFDRP